MSPTNGFHDSSLLALLSMSEPYPTFCHFSFANTYFSSFYILPSNICSDYTKWGCILGKGGSYRCHGKVRKGRAAQLCCPSCGSPCRFPHHHHHQLCTSSSYKSIALHIKILDRVESCKTTMRVSDPNDRLGNLLALIPHLIL